MRLSYCRKLTGAEINKTRLNKEAPMYNAFQEIWGDICKAVDHHNIDPLRDDVVVTFNIDWEVSDNG